MNTNTTLDYLLANPPRYELHADSCPAICELVGAGYLLVIARRVEFMVGSSQLPDGIAITYTLTLAGARYALTCDADARVHVGWLRRLAAESGAAA